MNCFSNLYKQYYHLQDCCKSLPADNGSTNLLQYGITKEYFSEMSKAAGLLRNFCEAIAKVDGVITLSESEWLNEIAPQTDGAQNNGQGN